VATPAQPSVDWPRVSPRASRLSDAVYSVIEGLITSGQLPPGARLPSERELATRLAVSRNSIREAVHELELKRLVERRPGSGTVVIDGAEENPHGSLLRQMTIADRNLLETMDFRQALEPPVAALAAERRTRADLARLSNILESMTDERHAARVAELDQAFHAAVARATHNRLLVRLHELSAEWLRGSRRDALQTKALRTASLNGHKRIFEALASHDPVAAHEAMDDHIGQVRRFIGAERPGEQSHGGRRDRLR
jgi:GntR family transcriptional repressor for pyruvate dehydrogenase complex